MEDIGCTRRNEEVDRAQIASINYRHKRRGKVVDEEPYRMNVECSYDIDVFKPTCK